MTNKDYVKESATHRSFWVALVVLLVGVFLSFCAEDPKMHAIARSIFRSLGGGMVAVAVISVAWDLAAKRTFFEEIILSIASVVEDKVNARFAPPPQFEGHGSCQSAFHRLMEISGISQAHQGDSTLDIAAHTGGSWYEYLKDQWFTPSRIRVLLMVDTNPHDTIRHDGNTVMDVLGSMKRKWDSYRNNGTDVEVRIINSNSAMFFGIANSKYIAMGPLFKKTGSWCWDPGHAFTYGASPFQVGFNFVEECQDWFNHHWEEGADLGDLLGEQAHESDTSSSE